jgi:hypothetical protein
MVYKIALTEDALLPFRNAGTLYLSETPRSLLVSSIGLPPVSPSLSAQVNAAISVRRGMSQTSATVPDRLSGHVVQLCPSLRLNTLCLLR